MCEISGEKAKIIETMSPSEIAEAAAKTLQIIFGPAVVESPVGCAVHKWGQDEFTFGSYFNYTVGVSPEHIRAMNRPMCAHVRQICSRTCSRKHSCLQFAGEGCNGAKIATLQGAYESGMKSALHIINCHLFGRKKKYSCA